MYKHVLYLDFLLSYIILTSYATVGNSFNKFLNISYEQKNLDK